MSTPKLTVVVPTYNAPHNLVRCLEALAASTAAHELIVVDDCSTQPEAVETARRLLEGRGRLIELEKNGGPGVARNAAVEVATGDVVVFIDSDVLVEPKTLERIGEVFAREPGIAALFGSYDDRPDSPGTITEYRNLLHHWVHQNGPAEASTFWAGCGAVRREVFVRLGGFDTELYDRPSIEDIELGMRIKSEGGRIRLCPEIQVKHLKRWRLIEMVKVDVTCRAIPWTRLLIDRPGTGGDLNLESGQKLCVAFVFLAVGAFLGGLALPFTRELAVWAWLPVLAVSPVIWINRGLYALFVRHRGAFFALAGVSLHLLYYLYSGVAFLYAHLSHASHKRRSEPAAA
jgi:glycosyltransferase involved in cell wall biosynthesis